MNKILQVLFVLAISMGISGCIQHHLIGEERSLYGTNEISGKESLPFFYSQQVKDWNKANPLIEYTVIEGDEPNTLILEGTIDYLGSNMNMTRLNRSKSRFNLLLLKQSVKNSGKGEITDVIIAPLKIESSNKLSYKKTFAVDELPDGFSFTYSFYYSY